MITCRRALAILGIALLAVLLALTGPTFFIATAQADVDTARIKALGWLITHQDGEGKWTAVPGAEVITTSVALESLRNAGVKGYPYAKAVSWLSNANASSTDALARQNIALYNAGMKVDPYMALLVARRSDKTNSWGAYDHYEGSFPDTSLALDAIKITATAYGNTSAGITFITSKQNADDGWSYTKSEPATPQSRVIPTAHNILTLNRYKAQFLSVSTNLASGITWLKSQQKILGSGCVVCYGFGEGSDGTIIETAWAYLAIVAEKGVTDAAAVNAQNFLIQKQLSDGSWGSDPLQTALTLQTFPATTLLDSDHDGIPDAVEAFLGTAPNVVDRGLLAKGNGQGVVGVNSPTVVAGAFLNKPFLFALPPISGAGQWAVVSGSLPPGLSLSSTTGMISGSPTTLGTFSFAYTDSALSPSSVLGVAQLTVYRSDPSLATGDLNSDGIVDAADVALAERITLGLIVATPTQLEHGDVSPPGNPDGVIDAADVSRIRLKALGVEGF